MRALVLGVVLVGFAAPAAAQTDVDSRWAGWLGCWTLVTEDQRRDGPVPVVAAIDRVRGTGPQALATPADPDEPRLCVEPAGPGGVTMRMETDGDVLSERTIMADGIARPIDGECRGTERAEWSRDGRVLFSRAELTCVEGAARTGSSLALIAPNGTWLDVEALSAGSQEGLVVRRYRRVDTPIAAGARTSGTRLTIDAVQEAVGHVPPAAIEVALVETGAAFDLRARQIVALADAGVPDRVIDLMVALSYPERFVVERRAPDPARVPNSLAQSRFGSASRDIWWYNYAPFGYFSPAYFASSGLFFDPFVPVIPGVIVVGGTGSGSASGQSGATPRSQRAINDLGYTRVQPREVEPRVAAPRSTATATGTGSTGSSPGSVTTSSTETSGSSGGASAGPDGFSSGGGGSTGRTAVPR